MDDLSDNFNKSGEDSLHRIKELGLALEGEREKSSGESWMGLKPKSATTRRV